MIGEHPISGLFHQWTECSDTDCTITKRHCQLLAKEDVRKQAIRACLKT